MHNLDHENKYFHFYNFISDQDQGLEALSKVISRQKEIAETIGNEVDLQNGESFTIKTYFSLFRARYNAGDYVNIVV